MASMRRELFGDIPVWSDVIDSARRGDWIGAARAVVNSPNVAGVYLPDPTAANILATVGFAVLNALSYWGTTVLIVGAAKDMDRNASEEDVNDWVMSLSESKMRSWGFNDRQVAAVKDRQLFLQGQELVHRGLVPTSGGLKIGYYGAPEVGMAYDVVDDPETGEPMILRHDDVVGQAEFEESMEEHEEQEQQESEEAFELSLTMPQQVKEVFDLLRSAYGYESAMAFSLAKQLVNGEITWDQVGSDWGDYGTESEFDLSEMVEMAILGDIDVLTGEGFDVAQSLEELEPEFNLDQINPRRSGYGAGLPSSADVEYDYDPSGSGDSYPNSGFSYKGGVSMPQVVKGRDGKWRWANSGKPVNASGRRSGYRRRW